MCVTRWTVFVCHGVFVWMCPVSYNLSSGVCRCLFSPHHVNPDGVQDPKPETRNPKPQVLDFTVDASKHQYKKTVALVSIQESTMWGSICSHRTSAFWCASQLVITEHYAGTLLESLSLSNYC